MAKKKSNTPDGRKKFVVKPVTLTCDKCGHSWTTMMRTDARTSTCPNAGPPYCFYNQPMPGYTRNSDGMVVSKP